MIGQWQSTTLLIEWEKQGNTVLLNAYWIVGRIIVEDEQKNERRAEYGKRVLKELAK